MIKEDGSLSGSAIDIVPLIVEVSVTEPVKNAAQTANVKVQKWTMGIIFLLMLTVIAAVDLFAYQNGANATISQCWITVNRKFWFMTYVLAILVGILLQHVSVARNPGVIPDPGFWRQTLLWTPFFWIGLYIGYRWLYQYPNVD